jgi:hypothetical protein
LANFGESFPNTPNSGLDQLLGVAPIDAQSPFLDRFLLRDDSGHWRVLKQAGLLAKWNDKPSKKGTGFRRRQAA